MRLVSTNNVIQKYKQMKKTTLILIVILLEYFIGSAQNDIQFSNFMFNKLSFNPATASYNDFSGSLTVRQQWTGLNEAPCSQMLNVHTTFEKLGGIGLSVINDKLGYENSINAHLIYARNFMLSEKAFFSVGAGIGLTNKSFDYSKLIFEEQGDQNASKALNDETKPDFCFGLTFNTSNFTVALSSTHLTKSLDKSTLYKTPRHYYIFSSYEIKTSDKVDIIPSIFIKSSTFITQYEINTNTFYNDKFWIGLSYRINDSYIGLIGFNITKNLRLAYSYDINANDLSSYSNGSHEFMLLFSANEFKRDFTTKSSSFFYSPESE